MTVDVRRSATRGRTRAGGVDSRHSFSYGSHWEPGNTAYGLLLACNEDVLQPGAGFPDHPHRDLEVVTWVVSGTLAHRDSTGGSGVLGPGGVQRLSAGRGVVHAEQQTGDGPVHYVQTWVAPAALDTAPSYATADCSAALAAGALVPVVGDGGLLPLGQPAATLLAGRLPAGREVALPDAPHVHLLVVRGAVALEDADALQAGDAARLTRDGGRRLTATDDAEVLVWAMRQAQVR